MNQLILVILLSGYSNALHPWLPFTNFNTHTTATTTQAEPWFPAVGWLNSHRKWRETKLLLSFSPFPVLNHATSPCTYVQDNAHAL